MKLLRCIPLKMTVQRIALIQGHNAQVHRVRLADGRSVRGAHFKPNLLFLYRKTVNISRNLAFGRREKNWWYKKLLGGGGKLKLGGVCYIYSG